MVAHALHVADDDPDPAAAAATAVAVLIHELLEAILLSSSLWIPCGTKLHVQVWQVELPVQEELVTVLRVGTRLQEPELIMDRNRMRVGLVEWKGLFLRT